jgi:hypothetical protein
VRRERRKKKKEREILRGFRRFGDEGCSSPLETLLSFGTKYYK